MPKANLRHDSPLQTGSLYSPVRFDPVTGVTTAVPGPFPADIPFSNLFAHIIRDDGLVLDKLPPGAFAEMLREHAGETDAKNDAAALQDGCEVWYRWPVGHGVFIDLKLYHGHGRLQVPESLRSHAEVEAVIEEIIFGHYIEQPAINRVLHERGAEAAVDMIEAIPVHLYVEEDR